MPHQLSAPARFTHPRQHTLLRFTQQRLWQPRLITRSSNPTPSVHCHFMPSRDEGHCKQPCHTARTQNVTQHRNMPWKTISGHVWLDASQTLPTYTSSYALLLPRINNNPNHPLSGKFWRKTTETAELSARNICTIYDPIATKIYQATNTFLDYTANYYKPSGSIPNAGRSLNSALLKSRLRSKAAGSTPISGHLRTDRC